MSRFQPRLNCLRLGLKPVEVPLPRFGHLRKKRFLKYRFTCLLNFLTGFPEVLRQLRLAFLYCQKISAGSVDMAVPSSSSSPWSDEVSEEVSVASELLDESLSCELVLYTS